MQLFLNILWIALVVGAVGIALYGIIGKKGAIAVTAGNAEFTVSIWAVVGGLLVLAAVIFGTQDAMNGPTSVTLTWVGSFWNQVFNTNMGSNPFIPGAK